MESTWEYKRYTVSSSPRAGSPVPPDRQRRPPAIDVQSWCDTSHMSEPTDSLEEEEESPGAYEYECVLSRSRSAAPPAIRHQGWLLKAYGSGAGRRWRRRWVYLTADRLCYTSDPTLDGVRYIPLDRIPVRALPRGYGPKIGVVQHDGANPGLPPSPKRAGCVLSVACGSHTHFLAAETPAAARAWVEAITDAWTKCVKHTARGGHVASDTEVAAFREAAWRAEASALRASLEEARDDARDRDGEYWQRWTEAQAKLRALEAAQAARGSEAPAATYEIQVVTGDSRGAGTSSAVFLELMGEGDARSGEYRLLYKDPARMAFQRGATDTFKLRCRDLGRLASARIWHNASGPSPGWLLAELRVRRRGEARWTVFPCGRWLAADQEDGHVERHLACGPEQPPPVPAATVQRLGASPSEPAWYQIVVCTSDLPDAGTSSEVWLVLQGEGGSSARVSLPSAAGDFGRGREDVFRLALAGVGAPQRLTVGVVARGQAPAWHLEQVEVTEEATGKTTYFPCSRWLSRDIAKDGGQPERTLLGSPINPRRLAELEAEAKRLTEALEAARAERAALQVAADKAASDLRAREAAQAAADKLLADTKQENSMLHEQSEDLTAKLARAEAAAETAEAELERVRAELSSARATEKAVAAERGRLQQALEGRQAEAAGTEATARALREELASKSSELGRVRAEAGGLRRQLDDLTGEAEEAKVALAALRAEREAVVRRSGGAAAELEASVARLTAELEAAQGRLSALQRAKEEAERRAEEGARREVELASKLQAAQDKAAAAAAAASLPPAPVNTTPPQGKAQLEEAGPSAPASPARAQVRYTARVWVKDVTGTLQPDSLCLTLLGSGGSTGPQRLDISAAGSEVQPAGGAASVVACAFSAPNVGRMERARLGLVAGGGVGAAGTPAVSAARLCAVLLSRLSVRCEASGESATFWCTPEAWLSSSDDFDYEYDAAAHAQGEAQGGACRYRLEVQTSDLRRAGTRGHVYLTLLGDHAAAGPFLLSNTGGSHFGRGALDTFVVGSAPDVGTIRQVEVRHDARGKRDGWHLAWVKVTNESTGAVAMFPCSRWIDRQEGEAAVTAVATAVGPGSPLPPPKEDAAAGGEDQADGPEAQPGYQIAFHTSRVCMSGTNARPFFELVGQRGSSGLIHPLGGDRSFKPGRVDLPSLGRLSALRVGTDGTGIFPAWGLAWVEVSHLPTGQRWMFALNDWIGKKHKYVRWLTLESTPEGSVVPGKAKWGPSWPGTGGGGGIGAAPATPVVGGALPFGGVSIGGAMAIGAFRPATALPAIRTRPASPAAPASSGQSPAPQQQQLGAHFHSQQQSPQLAWGGLGAAMGGAAGSSSPTRKVMVPGSPSGGYIGGQWPAATRPGSAGAVSTHSNSILDVLAAPTASPLASGARFPVPW